MINIKEIIKGICVISLTFYIQFRMANLFFYLDDDSIDIVQGLIKLWLVIIMMSSAFICMMYFINKMTDKTEKDYWVK